MKIVDLRRRAGYVLAQTPWPRNNSEHLIKYKVGKRAKKSALLLLLLLLKIRPPSSCYPQGAHLKHEQIFSVKRGS